jgi:hypothetical protein
MKRDLFFDKMTEHRQKKPLSSPVPNFFFRVQNQTEKKINLTPDLKQPILYAS